MDNKYFNLIIFAIGIFVLGLYASSHFRFNQPISPERWFITAVFCFGNLALFFGNSKGE